MVQVHGKCEMGGVGMQHLQDLSGVAIRNINVYYFFIYFSK